MINVSNDFKEAIKSQNREIHGYVDVKYQNNSYSRSVTQIPTPLNIVSSDGSGIIRYNKIMTKYATLEDNYTLLDGSFMVWNENTINNNGYVSNDLFKDITDNTIIITNNSTSVPSKGLTIYFKENLPFDFDITITDVNDDEFSHVVTNNQSYNYQYVFPTEIYIKTIEIHINNIEFPKRRIRIAYVDFNLGDLYEGDELVNFDVTEELDLLGESIPINTCSININNYPTENGGNKFDPINPVGITKFLTADATIEPYIGILTKENGIEYVKMGTFYLDDWSSDIDGNVSLNGKSVLNKLKNIVIHPNSEFFSGSAKDSSNLSDIIRLTANVDTYFLLYSNSWNIDFLENEYLFNYLSSVMSYLLYFDSFSTEYIQYRKFYVDRYDNICLDELFFSKVDSISEQSLLEDVNYVTRNKIKRINVKQDEYGVYSNNRQSTIVPTISYTLNDTENYVWFKSNNIIQTLSLSSSTVSGSATATLIGHNQKLICIKITGTIGSVISISCSGRITDAQSVSRLYTYNNDDVEDGEVVDIDLTNSVQVSADYYPKIFFDLNKNYKVTAKTTGDPSLEIGDTISIQTRYKDVNDGYKDIIITKQKFTFDGGLQCELEGVGD